MFHAGCVIGDEPQDLEIQGRTTRVRIGEHNVFREHATVHRFEQAAKKPASARTNFLMGTSHIGHNCRLATTHHLQRRIGGSGMRRCRTGVPIRQQPRASVLRVGPLALMQGGSAISQDLPPFTVALRGNEICGLNVIGCGARDIPRNSGWN